MVAKAKMTQDITTQGYCSLKDIPYDIENKRALNTVNVYFLGAELITDLVPLDKLFNKGKDIKQYNRTKYEKTE